MEKVKQVLLDIQTHVKEAGLDAVLLPLDDGSGLEKVIVYGGKDGKDRLQLIEITSAGTEGPKGLKDVPIQPSFRIQIDACFPFTIADAALSDVAQFLHFINLQVELPGFYLDHLNDRILYRYVHLMEGDKPPKQLVLAVIGIALFLQDVFGQTFERLATGQATFPSLMEEIKKSLV